MDAVKFNLADLYEIFGQDAKLELIDGVIWVGDKSFEEAIETYRRIKERKLKAQDEKK